jgi:hypothetical protein
MAFCALGTEDPFMTVGFPMALHAGLRCFTELRGFMALQTIHLQMASDQLESRLIMVKKDPLPSLRRVTIFALSPESPLMLIPIEMTPYTCRRRRLKVIRGVAFLAGHRGMFSLERKFGFCMVETDFRPPFRIMATLAGRPQRSFVFIFFEVARITISRRISVLGFLMALIALGGQMLSGQMELGFIVIEVCRIELDRLGGSSLVFRVAGLAAGCVDPTVKAGFLFNVLFDLFMAGKAFIEKQLLNEVVAIQTSSLNFLVDPGHLSRHDPFQDIKGLGHPRCCDHPYDHRQAGSFPHRVSLKFHWISKISIRL